jgi:CO dehydrogenase maturation factor
MKRIIATGKGGVGKTTTTSTLVTMLAREGKKVLVFDTDPSMNLAMTLGLPYMEVPTITAHKEEISEDLDDAEDMTEIGREIFDKYSLINSDGVRVVVMGAIPDGGNGCLCSAISIIKIMLNYVESGECEKYDVAIVDSQAGPEVLGRGLAASFDLNLILSEPTAKSSEVSVQVKKLADDLGVKENLLVVNKIDYDSDVRFVANIVGIDISKAIGIPYDRDVVKADKEGELLLDAFPDSAALAQLRNTKDLIEKTVCL